MSIDFMKNTSLEIEEAVRKGAVVLLPIGQVEEHGPHLPVGTDTYIAEGVAQKVAEALQGEIPVLVMPAVWSTYSVDALGKWPGLIKVKTRTVIDLVHDIVASLLKMGFTKVILMNGHGNNPGILDVALRELADEFEAAPILANVWNFSAQSFSEVRKSPPGGAIHADEYETAMILAMGYPVDMSKAPSGESFRFESKFRARDNFSGKSMVTWSTWKLQQSRTGVYGDPTVATIETGDYVLQCTIREFVNLVREYHAWEPVATENTENTTIKL
jgi:creatinine amidohydrolase